MKELHIVEKILRTLTDRFEGKVIAIEETYDLSTITKSEAGIAETLQAQLKLKKEKNVSKVEECSNEARVNANTKNSNHRRGTPNRFRGKRGKRGRGRGIS
ncbi:hypothetical protein ACE6H2_007437 [Prunus campanulata]